MDLQLKGKRALITASSRGLGFATARILALEGARVAINGRDPDQLKAAMELLQKESKSEILGTPGDLTHADFPYRSFGPSGAMIAFGEHMPLI